MHGLMNCHEVAYSRTSSRARGMTRHQLCLPVHPPQAKFYNESEKHPGEPPAS